MKAHLALSLVLFLLPGSTHAGNNDYQRGQDALAKKDYQHGFAFLKKTLALDPKHTGAYCNRARMHAEMGNFGQAMADINQAIRIEPQEPWNYLERAQFHERRGDFDQALADADHAIR